MPLSSNSLFHFTSKGRDVLQSIIKTGFRPSYVQEINVARLMTLGPPSVAHSSFVESQIPFEFYLNIPVVSFCDIPLSAVNNHAIKYSNPAVDNQSREVFAIGLTKNWGIRNNIHPISYYVSGGRLTQSLQKSVVFADVPKQQLAEGETHIPPDVYCPPAEMGTGHMIRDNKGWQYPIQTLFAKPIGQIYNYHREHFQDEKEWRYIPENAMIISKMVQMRGSVNYRTYQTELSNAERALEEAKSKDAYTNLVFQPEDISHIILNKEEEIPEFLNFLHEFYSANFDENTIRVLFSKVTSYDRILNDYSYL